MTEAGNASPQGDRAPPRGRQLQGLSHQEVGSITHGDFWIPEGEREVYKRALRSLNAAGVPYVVAGAYAIYEHTGIYRQTKDLDVFLEPTQVVPAMRALHEEGFVARLEQAHWLAKAVQGDYFVDIIYGMGNGLASIDDAWYRHSKPAILAATPVRVAPVEELIWHRLFINERHRHDMADIAHLIFAMGPAMDWHRLVEKTGEHWPLLLSQLLMFNYVYPEHQGGAPKWVMTQLLERARREMRRERSGEAVTRGTLISRFSFSIDVNEWRLRDVRDERVRATSAMPVIREIIESDVWDERSASAEVTE